MIEFSSKLWTITNNHLSPDLGFVYKSKIVSYDIFFGSSRNLTVSIFLRRKLKPKKLVNTR